MDPYSAIVNDKSQPSYDDDVQNVFDGIMFLTACDDDFILKCEWIHISSGIMWNVYLSKPKEHHDTQHTQRVPHIIMCTQKINCLNS
jgi:hypothetical protein